jgi:hypothetical protein
MIKNKKSQKRMTVVLIVVIAFIILALMVFGNILLKLLRE